MHVRLSNSVDSEKTLRSRVVALEQDGEKARQAQREADAERRLVEKERTERTAESLSWREKHRALAEVFRAQEDMKALRQSRGVSPTTTSSLTVAENVPFHGPSPLVSHQCQANIKSYFLCMTESNQRVKILRNQDGSPRNFTVRTNGVCSLRLQELI